MKEAYLLSNDSKDHPFISVIIATRNEEHYIGELLNSLVNQTYPKNRFEVIVIDGLSTDATLEVVEDYRDTLDLRVLPNNRIRSTFAFNMGIDEAKGEKTNKSRQLDKIDITLIKLLSKNALFLFYYFIKKNTNTPRHSMVGY